MLNFLLKCAIGLGLGFMSGLGIGGGTLLILWLTMVENAPSPTARAINLMFFIAAAGAVSLLRRKNGSLAKEAILPAVCGGCISAAILAWISTMIDATILRKIFGALLIATGLRELFYRRRKAK